MLAQGLAVKLISECDSMKCVTNTFRSFSRQIADTLPRKATEETARAVKSIMVKIDSAASSALEDARLPVGVVALAFWTLNVNFRRFVAPASPSLPLPLLPSSAGRRALLR